MSKASGIKGECILGPGWLTALKASPGAYCFRGETRGDEWVRTALMYSCPCGCGSIGSINLDPSVAGAPVWQWSGQTAKVSITPSIGLIRSREDHDVEPDGYHWHGYLTEGVWRSVN